MGTEYRFLHQLQGNARRADLFKKRLVSFKMCVWVIKEYGREYWHGKAVEIAISFLPSESPLVSHILMSYEKHHSPSNQVIVRTFSLASNLFYQTLVIINKLIYLLKARR